MTEETQPATPEAVVEGTPEGQTAEAPAEITAPVVPTWQEELDKLDAKELRKHPKIAGLIGSEAQYLFSQKTKADQEEQQRKLRDATETELMKFTEDNADYLKEHYPRAYEHFMGLEQQRAARQVGGIRQQTVQEIGNAIAQSFAELPEYKEMIGDPATFEKLQKALAGKADHEVPAIFNRHALDFVAERRAARKFDEQYSKKVDELRAALKQEIAAEVLKSSDAPDVTRPKGQPVNKMPADMTKEEFDNFWQSLKKR